jgi:hypothetical protein
VLAAALTLSVAFAYQPVAPTPQEPNLAVQGRTVFVRSPDGVKPVGAFAYSLDGGEPRQFLLTKHAQNLDVINATPQALALQAADLPTWRVYYGPRNGPLRRLKKDVADIALSGSTMLSREGRLPHERIVARNVNGGPARRIGRPGQDLSVMQAAGPYVAVKDPKGRIIVLNWHTRRVVYRVHPTTGSYAIASDGRIVVLDGEFERIQTASPKDRHLRTIARVNTAPYALAIAGTRIVFEEILSRSTGRLVLLRPDGKRRAISPRMPLGGFGIAFDGRTLAFVSGDCVYAGPIPATTPTEPPPGCEEKHSKRSPTTSTLT